MVTVHFTIEQATELLDILTEDALKNRGNYLINDLVESLTYRLDKANETK